MVRGRIKNNKNNILPHDCVGLEDSNSPHWKEYHAAPRLLLDPNLGLGLLPSKPNAMKMR